MKLERIATPGMEPELFEELKKISLPAGHFLRWAHTVRERNIGTLPLRQCGDAWDELI